MNKGFLIIVILLISGYATAQKNVLTVGIQYKPVFPSRYFDGGPLELEKDGFVGKMTQKYGHNIGLPVRYGITNWLSAETGISFIQRNYKLDFEYADSSLSETSSLKIISYQIPLKAMFFVRLSERIYMNVAVGAAMILFPSDVEKKLEVTFDDFFIAEGRRGKGGWFQGALLADLGFEYRTEKKGYFYLGASYHMPFAPIMYIAMAYQNENGLISEADRLRSSFLTLDLRYYFPEKELKKRKKKEFEE